MSTTTNSTTAAATNKATELLLNVMLQRTRGKVTRDSNCALVKQLLTAGGDFNGKDSQGFPPLTIVAWRGHTEEAQLILKAESAHLQSRIAALEDRPPVVARTPCRCGKAAKLHRAYPNCNTV